MPHHPTEPLSYSALFDDPERGGAGLRAVVIPMIQRDYAQGRSDAATTRIREDFLKAICGAATGSRPPVSLDFVYGAVRGGVLSPLDGQQRLTALFLLHWVAAVRAGTLQRDSAWSDFAYATRDSARMFTERIVRHGADLAHGDQVVLRRWIEDQPWHLHAWRHDASVQSMLVVIGEIEAHLSGTPAAQVWERLLRRDAPVISFRLLPIDGHASAGDQLGDLQGDELYLKMNSRGKPLTEFENLKALLQRMLVPVGRADEFAHKVDGVWSDLLWSYRGDDELVDDEFVRLLEFIHDICRWRDAARGGTDRETAFSEGTHGGAARLDERLRGVLVESPDADRHLAYFFQLFDIWSDEDPASFFTRHFTADDGDAHRVRLFVADGDEDLFHSACRRYQGWDTRSRGDRGFSIADTLMLHAVLVHRSEGTESFPTRARVLRNLLGQRENRSGEIPQLLREVEAFVRTGDLAGATTLGWDSDREDEQAKLAFVQRWPELESTIVRLENHPLLRGSLTVFDLDPRSLPARAAAFPRLVDPQCIEEFHGALLAEGFTPLKRWRRGARLLAGTSASGRTVVWRELFQYEGRAGATNLRDALGGVLDAVGPAGQEATAHVLQTRARRGWEEAVVDGALRLRHYLARYPEMRRGESGQFELEDGSEYQACALRRTQLNSNYRDPYLSAGLALAEVPADAVEERWFTGYASRPRWLEMPGSGRVRVRDAGIQVEVDERATIAPDVLARIQQPLVRRGENPAPDEGARGVPVAFRALPGGRIVDAQDRVAVLAETIELLWHARRA